MRNFILHRGIRVGEEEFGVIWRNCKGQTQLRQSDAGEFYIRFIQQLLEEGRSIVLYCINLTHKTISCTLTS